MHRLVAYNRVFGLTPTLDGMFDDAEAWGVSTLKEWIDNYESSRFTAIDRHTAVITSEYNMECLKEWLEKYTSITEKLEY